MPSGHLSGTPGHWVAIVVGTEFLPCQYINASADCTVNGIDARGVPVAGLTLLKGTNAVGLKRVDFLSTGSIFAGYL